MKTLLLTLSKEPFEVMVTGEKQLEFRKRSDWIISRLFDKHGNIRHYDRIKFVNGYGDHRPMFICEYIGFHEMNCDHRTVVYSNGLTVDNIVEGDFVISCGAIIERRNITLGDL